MPNTTASDSMSTFFEDMIDDTNIGVNLSSSIRKYHVDPVEAERSGDTFWLPQEFRFEAIEGSSSDDNDFQDIADRMVPINLSKEYFVPFKITAKESRDPRLLRMASKAASKAVRNIIDFECANALINGASMVVRNTGNFGFEDSIDAELLMDDAGFSGSDGRLVLAAPHYRQVAKELGNVQRTSTNLTAFEKAQIPPMGGFDTMKADYRKNLPANAITNIVINGNQSHTILTKIVATGQFLDNRSMTLLMTNATAANMPEGTKFTIANVNRLHPETKESTGSLMSFAVKTGVDGAPVIQPAIVIAGPHRNCDAQAVAGAAVTMLNTHVSAPSIFFTDESVVLVPGILPVQDEDNSGWKQMTTEQGIPVQMTFERNFHTGDLSVKLQVFFDVQVVCPEQVGVILANQS